MPATKTNALSAAQVRSLKTAGTFSDGNGLTLRIDANGNKRWFQRVSIGGKQRNVGIGSYPTTTLATARETAFANLQAARQGRDVIADKRQAKEEAQKPSIPTFAEAAAQTIELRRPVLTEKHVKEWQSTLARYAFPTLGNKRVDEITSSDILRVLEPIWHTKATTAARLRNRIEIILDKCIAEGWIQYNVAGKAVTKALPKQSSEKLHHTALHYSALPETLERIRESDATPISRLALEFLILNASRANEVRGAEWSEIDWESATWIVPAARMKARREHRVPMSNQAIRVLEQAWEINADSPLIFASRRGGKMAELTLIRLLHILEIPATIHGMRSCFKDWSIEQTAFPWVVSEAALAHRLGDSTETAYARTDVLTQRRQLMQEWATFIAGSP